jgi:hypothetical protein
MRSIMVATAAVLLAVSSGRSAQADPLSTAMDLVTKANSQAVGTSKGDGVSSLRVRWNNPNGSSNHGVIDLSAHREYVAMAGPNGTTSSEMYMANDMEYSRLVPGGKWQRMDIHPDVLARSIARLNKFLTPADRMKQQKRDNAARAVRLTGHELPERWVHGVKYRTFLAYVRTRDIDSRAADTATTATTCVFKKVGTDSVFCTAANFKKFNVTMDRFNDPANRITIPPEALNAPLISFDSMGPRAIR